MQALAQAREALEQRLDLGVAIGIAARDRRRARGCRARVSSGNTCRPSGTSTSAARRDPVRRRAARCARRRARSRRSTGRSRPLSARISVDLPAPLAPSTATISPARPRRSMLVEHRRGAVAGAELRRASRIASCDAASSARGARPRAHARRRRDRPCSTARIAPHLARACRRRSRAPASSTTTWSEMPITSAMSCSTRTTAMPRSAMRRSSALERGLVGAHQAGGRLVEQQHLRPRRQRAGDLDQAPVDMRQIAGAACRARRDSRRRRAAPRRCARRSARGGVDSGSPSRPRRSAISTLSSTLMRAEQLRGLVGAGDAGARDAPGRRAGELACRRAGCCRHRGR